MFDDPYAMAKDCHGLAIITEWNEFKQLDLGRIRAAMKSAVIFDGRNIYNPDELRSLGFTYRGVGRGFNGK
jgi:UDPglucose 6-dehydrogenase